MTVPSPYGQWPSPLTVDAVASVSSGFSWPGGDRRKAWWCVSDPATATVRLMRRDTGATTDVLGARWSVRNRYMGYGGRPYAVRNGTHSTQVVFTNHEDQRLYLWGDGAGIKPLTPIDETACYADPQFAGKHTAVCLREITRPASGADDSDPAPRTSRAIVAVAFDGSGVRELARSHHFLACPRLSRDGKWLAWIGWEHPRMPWDGTQVMLARVTRGKGDGAGASIGPAGAVLGGDDVSVPQIEWGPDGMLYAMADPAGWWNLHRIDPAGSGAECVLPMEEECAGAMWRAGSTWFAVLEDARVVLHHGVGDQQLAVWDPADGSLRDLAPGWTAFGSLAACPDGVLVSAESATERAAILHVPVDGGEARRLTSEPATARFGHYVSVPERRVFKGPDGRDIHAVFYPPTSPVFTGDAGALPPLLVHVHGGPTSNTGAGPNDEFSLFTSRGFAVVSVDYGGSTGYGRAYRERLRNGWGVVDRDDAVAVALALADAGEVDRDRMAIRGGSAGGWTSLACLGGSDVFCAGAVYFPISDATNWSAGNTHDFESQYLTSLIGEWPAESERYREVSPLSHVDSISAPLVMLQGADDFICPPHHAQVIVHALAERGLWHQLHIFEGEGHGFRKASSTRTALLAESHLYSHAMGISVDLGAK